MLLLGPLLQWVQEKEEERERERERERKRERERESEREREREGVYSTFVGETFLEQSRRKTSPSKRNRKLCRVVATRTTLERERGNESQLNKERERDTERVCACSRGTWTGFSTAVAD